MKEFMAHEQSQKAVAVRQARARLKKDIKTGRLDPLSVFDDGVDRVDPVAQGLRVDWFLRSLPGWGTTKAERFLHQVGVNPRLTLGGLRVRQRAAFRRHLADVVGETKRLASRGSLVVVAGPTAVGKGTIMKKVLADHPSFSMSVSATTRPPRPGEIDGVD
jgi:guanylate kinase